MADHPIFSKSHNPITAHQKESTANNWKMVISCVVIFAFISSACLLQSSLPEIIDQSFIHFSGGDRETDELAITWQKNIDDMWNLLGSQQIPTYLMEEDPVLRGNEFDIMSVFTILDRISVIEGYRLAYVYHFDGMGGYPIVFTYQEGTEPYLSLDEFLSEQPECFVRTQKANDCDILTYLETDGSPLGYLQLVLFDVMKGQFYLYWHAAYRDQGFIATPEALEVLIGKISDPLIPLTGFQQRKAQRIDFTPQVVIGEETVEIRAVWFTKWGGFYESNYVLSREHPHII